MATCSDDILRCVVKVFLRLGLKNLNIITLPWPEQVCARARSCPCANVHKVGETILETAEGGGAHVPSYHAAVLS